LCADESKIDDPVKNDLKLIHWSDSASFVILVSLCCENLGYEHGDADYDDHDDLVPSIVCCVSSAISKE